MPIFRVKSVKIYTGQKNLHWRRQWRQWQLSGMCDLRSDLGGKLHHYICTLFFSGVQPRECRVGLRDLPRGRRGDSLLHRDRLRHEEDRHQHTRHPLHEGLRSWRSWERHCIMADLNYEKSHSVSSHSASGVITNHPDHPDHGQDIMTILSLPRTSWPTWTLSLSCYLFNLWGRNGKVTRWVYYSVDCRWDVEDSGWATVHKVGRAKGRNAAIANDG